MLVPSRKFALGTACVLDFMGEHVIKARDCHWISSVDVNTYIIHIVCLDVKQEFVRSEQLKSL